MTPTRLQGPALRVGHIVARSIKIKIQKTKDGTIILKDLNQAKGQRIMCQISTGGKPWRRPEFLIQHFIKAIAPLLDDDEAAHAMFKTRFL